METKKQIRIPPENIGLISSPVPPHTTTSTTAANTTHPDVDIHTHRQYFSYFWTSVHCIAHSSTHTTDFSYDGQHVTNSSNGVTYIPALFHFI